MQTHFAHMSLETLRVLCSMVCCRYMSIVMFHFLLCVVVVVVLFWLKGVVFCYQSGKKRQSRMILSVTDSIKNLGATFFNPSCFT